MGGVIRRIGPIQGNHRGVQRGRGGVRGGPVQRGNQNGRGGVIRGGGRGNGGRGRGLQEQGGLGNGRGGWNNNRGVQYGAGGYGRTHQQHGVFNVGPYGEARGQQQDYNLGPSLFDRIPREQNYLSEGRNPPGSGQFQYPTNPTGPFARAMSQVTCNPTTANQGTVAEQNLFGRELFEQLQMALTCINRSIGSQWAPKSRRACAP